MKEGTATARTTTTVGMLATAELLAAAGTLETVWKSTTAGMLPERAR